MRPAETDYGECTRTTKMRKIHTKCCKDVKQLELYRAGRRVIWYSDFGKVAATAKADHPHARAPIPGYAATRHVHSCPPQNMASGMDELWHGHTVQYCTQ